MTRATIVGGASVALLVALVLLAAAASFRTFHRNFLPAATNAPAMPSSSAPAAAESGPMAENDQGFLYGRISAVDGASYEGRLRWGGDQEAFWSDSFNGSKHENRWLVHVPPERLLEKHPIELFGIGIAERKVPIDTGRQLLVPFGEIVRIEALGREVRVTLKSGSVYDLDRLEAGDTDDGVRVWDVRHGVVDLDSRRIRTIELLPTPALAALPGRLHGTVRTRQGDFTGYLQWNWKECLGTDELVGRTAEGELRLRFDSILSIARRARDSALVTLVDGREIALTDMEDAGGGGRGVQVGDRRFGRVLVSWDAFERVDFDRPADGDPGGSGPAYGDFPPGRPLSGSVTTRAGRRLAGRLVYDLDESETFETLEAPFEGVTYMIPFGQVASIVLPGREERDAPRATVTLQNGEKLQLESAGDLGDENAGLLIFVDGGDGGRRPEYVPWSDVERIDFERPPGPPAIEPPLGGS